MIFCLKKLQKGAILWIIQVSEAGTILFKFCTALLVAYFGLAWGRTQLS